MKNNKKQVLALILGVTLLSGGMVSIIVGMEPGKPNRTLPNKPVKLGESELSKYKAAEITTGTPSERFEYLHQLLLQDFPGMHKPEIGSNVYFAIQDKNLTEDMITRVISYWRRLYNERLAHYTQLQNFGAVSALKNVALDHINQLEKLLKEIRMTQNK